MRVKDWMDPAPAFVELTDTVEKAAALMIEREMRALPVVDAEGRLCGLVRDLDLVHLLLPSYLESLPDLSFVPAGWEPTAGAWANLVQTPIKALLREEKAYSVEEDETVLEAVRLMWQHNADAVPVVREGRLVGVLDARRLLEAMAKGMPSAGDEE